MTVEDDLLDDDDILDELDELEDGSEEELPEESTEEIDPVVKGLRQYGLNIPDGIDGKTLADNIAYLARRQSSLPSDMELAEMREIKSRYQQDREASRQETPAPEKSSKLAKPEGADLYTVFDEKAGMYVPKDPRFPNIKAVEAMNEWHQAVESNRRRLLEDPEDYFKKTFNLDERLEQVKKTAKEEAIQEFRDQLRKQVLEQERNQFWEKHAPELYEVDGNGYVKIDPITGQQILSEKGFKFLEEKQSIEADFPNADPLVIERKAFEKADRWEKTKKARAAKASKQTEEESPSELEAASPEEPTPEQVAEAQKRNYAKKARSADENGKRTKGDRVINRDASLVQAARTGDTQNSGVTDFQALARDEARKRGLKLNF